MSIPYDVQPAATGKLTRGSLRANHAGQEVVLESWLNRRRDLGGLIFVDLRDRYLDLRRARMQRNVILRHRVITHMCDYFDARGFVDIETPLLIKSAPEGARDFLVPSSAFPGSFYALPQSPQQLSRPLLVSGYDRYFQIGRCFRDEEYIREGNYFPKNQRGVDLMFGALLDIPRDQLDDVGLSPNSPSAD